MALRFGANLRSLGAEAPFQRSKVIWSMWITHIQMAEQLPKAFLMVIPISSMHLEAGILPQLLRQHLLEVSRLRWWQRAPTEVDNPFPKVQTMLLLDILQHLPDILRHPQPQLEHLLEVGLPGVKDSHMWVTPSKSGATLTTNGCEGRSTRLMAS